MRLPSWQPPLKPPSAARNFPKLLGTGAPAIQSSFPLTGSGLCPHRKLLPAPTCYYPFPSSAVPPTSNLTHLIPPCMCSLGRPMVSQRRAASGEMTRRPRAMGWCPQGAGHSPAAAPPHGVLSARYSTCRALQLARGGGLLPTRAAPASSRCQPGPSTGPGVQQMLSKLMLDREQRGQELSGLNLRLSVSRVSAVGHTGTGEHPIAGGV